MLLERTYTVPDYSNSVYGPSRDKSKDMGKGKDKDKDSSGDVREGAGMEVVVDDAALMDVDARAPRATIRSRRTGTTTKTLENWVDDEDDENDVNVNVGVGNQDQADDGVVDEVHRGDVPWWVYVLGWQSDERLIFRADRTKRIQLEEVRCPNPNPNPNPTPNPNPNPNPTRRRSCRARSYSQTSTFTMHHSSA